MTEAVSYIFSLLSNKLYGVKFEDLFSKVDKFENSVSLKNNLKKMNLSLTEINLSRSTSVILSKKTKKEKKINGILNKLGKNDIKQKDRLTYTMKRWLETSKKKEKIDSGANEFSKKNKNISGDEIKKQENNEIKAENSNIIINEKKDNNNKITEYAKELCDEVKRSKILGSVHIKGI